MIRWLVVFGLVALPAPLFAQDLNLHSLNKDKARALTLTTGAESGFVASIGYSHALGLGAKKAMVFAEATAPWAEVDLGDWRMRVGGMVALLERGNWKLSVRAAAIVRSAQTDLSHMTNIGLDAAVLPGYYKAGWFVSAEARLDWAMLSYIHNTEQYRETYPDAQDGWYSLPGAGLSAGLAAGVSVGDTDIVARLGQQRDIRGDVAPLPLYATLGATWRF